FIAAEEFDGVLQAPALRLRQEEEHEHPPGRSYAGVEVEAPGEGDGLVERDEGHADGAAHDPVHRRAERASLRAQPQREDLRAVHPRDRAHPDGEGRHEHQHHRDAQTHQRRRLALRAVLDHVQRRGQRDERDHHPAGAGEEQRPPADAVEEERGHEDEERLAGAHRHGGSDGVGVGVEARVVEHPRAVQHDGVDAGGLLEELEAEAGDEYAAHGRRRAEQQVPPDTLAVGAPALVDDGYNFVLVGDPFGDADRVLDVREPLLGLGRRVGGLLEDTSRVADAPLHDEPPRRLRHGEDAHGEEGGRHGAD
ncbi:Os03g0197175, partial [Oryza sativa Japonica Group]